MRREDENGAIVVEATISLSVFIFVIFTILSIVNICYIQAKMNTALNTAAKEISQYSYLYFKFGLNKTEQGWAEAGQKSGATVDQIAGGVAGFIDVFKSGDMSTTIGKGYENAVSVKEGIDDIVSDPKAFALGIAQGTLVELFNDAKSTIPRAFVKKNLVAFEGDTPEAFLKRYKVVGGMDGMDFTGTQLMLQGESGLIKIVVTYKVKVIELLKIDMEFTFRQYAVTDAWGCEGPPELGSGTKSAAILPPRRRIMG